MAEPYIGEIRIFPYGFAPKNWAYCDGQLINITQNGKLFSVLKTVYGGDGRKTFALPNLAGKSPMAAGQGKGLTDRPLGEMGGAATVTLTKDHIPSHTHTLTVTKNDSSSGKPEGLYPAKHQGADRGFIYRENSVLDSSFAPEAISNTGSSEPHMNMQPFLAVPFCIALDGVYPNRN